MTTENANRVMLKKLGIVAVAMFGFGFLLIPFYNKICEVSGLNKGGEQELVRNTQIDKSRKIRLELDANINENMPWRFTSTQPIVEVHPGQLMQVDYKVVNNSDLPVTGQAVPSYAPALAVQYFKKIECFCFTKQVLKPHETRIMPVLFVIDPKLPKDVKTITLSYTFFNLNPNVEAVVANNKELRG
ncbi:MAG: cytochrome c oxidase assembly protein [Pseudomonadota bacterium]